MALAVAVLAEAPAAERSQFPAAAAAVDRAVVAPAAAVARLRSIPAAADPVVAVLAEAEVV